MPDTEVVGEPEAKRRKQSGKQAGNRNGPANTREKIIVANIAANAVNSDFLQEIAEFAECLTQEPHLVDWQNASLLRIEDDGVLVITLIIC